MIRFDMRFCFSKSLCGCVVPLELVFGLETLHCIFEGGNKPSHGWCSYMKSFVQADKAHHILDCSDVLFLGVNQGVSVVRRHYNKSSFLPDPS